MSVYNFVSNVEYNFQINRICELHEKGKTDKQISEIFIHKKIVNHKLNTIEWTENNIKEIRDSYQIKYNVRLAGEEPDKGEGGSNKIKSVKRRVSQPASKAGHYKIIGGSFGLKGELVVNKNRFNVYSSQDVAFDRTHVKDIILQSTGKEKRYSFFSIFFGLILTLVLTALFSIVGLIAGIMVTVFGSIYNIKKPDIATILLKDGKKIEVTGKIDRLLAAA